MRLVGCQIATQSWRLTIADALSDLTSAMQTQTMSAAATGAQQIAVPDHLLRGLGSRAIARLNRPPKRCRRHSMQP